MRGGLRVARTRKPGIATVDVDRSGQNCFGKQLGSVLGIIELCNSTIPILGILFTQVK